MPIVSNAACQAAYGEKFTVTNGMMCAAFRRAGWTPAPAMKGDPSSFTMARRLAAGRDRQLQVSAAVVRRTNTASIPVFPGIHRLDQNGHEHHRQRDVSSHRRELSVDGRVYPGNYGEATDTEHSLSAGREQIDSRACCGQRAAGHCPHAQYSPRS